jgi:hypothetical protein
MLGKTNNYKDDVVKLIEDSIIERQGNICDT